MDRLDLREAAVPVVLGGGMFRSADGHLPRCLADDIAAFAPSADVRPLTVPPVLGAALLGLDLLDADADAASRAAAGLVDAGLEGEGSPAVSP